MRECKKADIDFNIALTRINESTADPNYARRLLAVPKFQNRVLVGFTESDESRGSMMMFIGIMRHTLRHFSQKMKGWKGAFESGEREMMP